MIATLLSLVLGIVFTGGGLGGIVSWLIWHDMGDNPPWSQSYRTWHVAFCRKLLIGSIASFAMGVAAWVAFVVFALDKGRPF